MKYINLIFKPLKILNYISSYKRLIESKFLIFLVGEKNRIKNAVNPPVAQKNIVGTTTR